MKPVSNVRINWLVCVAVCYLAMAFGESNAIAQSNDKFDGAVWKFTMTLRKGKRPTLNGAFRVSNHVLYQKASPGDREFTKVIGKDLLQGKITRIEFTNFRAFGKDRTKHQGFKGTARLKLNEFGDWSGQFTDGQGRNWDFKCNRVQE